MSDEAKSRAEVLQGLIGETRDWKALAEEEEAASVREYDERQARLDRLKAIGMDLGDPMVRRLANDRHVPAETWHAQMDGKTFGRVYCDACLSPWPCEVRLALRDMEAE